MNATIVTRMRKRDPFRADNLVRYAARAARRAAPKAKQIALATDTTEASARRHRVGDDTSPYTHVLVLFHELAAHEKTTATHLLMESWHVVISTEWQAMTDEQLVAAYDAHCDGEHGLEAHETRLRSRLDLRSASPDRLREAADAGMDEAAVEVARAAIERIVAERKESGVWTL